MKIAIIGSGNVGTALASGLINAGHEVIFGVRDPQSVKSQKAADAIAGAALLSIADATANAEAIIITTPPDAVPELLGSIANINDKVIIDATNSVMKRAGNYPTALHAIKDLTGAQDVCKCFNSTGAENMANPVYGDVHLDMFTAGDSIKAKAVAQQLAKDIGFAECYDFGGDDKAELLEKLALCWINLAIMQKQGRNIAFKILRR